MDSELEIEFMDFSELHLDLDTQLLLLEMEELVLNELDEADSLSTSEIILNEDLDFASDFGFAPELGAGLLLLRFYQI